MLIYFAMNFHEGISCNVCLKSNIQGKRFKCLTCFDYDLCSTCYNNKSVNLSHTNGHPIQCILPRTDYELYYGGEVKTDHIPPSITCPYCCKVGLTITALKKHLTEHSGLSCKIICPICACLPQGNPNFVTDNFAQHLAVEHSYTHNIAPFQHEIVRRNFNNVRHICHAVDRRTNNRSRLNNYFVSSPSGNVDLISEMISQLSGVERSMISNLRNHQYLDHFQGRTTRSAQILTALKDSKVQVPAANVDPGASNKKDCKLLPARELENQLIRSEAKRQCDVKENFVKDFKFLLAHEFEKQLISSETKRQHDAKEYFVQDILLSSFSKMMDDKDQEACTTPIKEAMKRLLNITAIEKVE